MFKLPLWMLGFLPILVAQPVLAQTHATVPAQSQTFPLTQEKDGVVVRLARARWGAENEFTPTMPIKDAAQRVLYLWYEVERPGATDKDSATMRWRQVERLFFGNSVQSEFFARPVAS